MAAAKEPGTKTVIEATNLVYETLEPFSADQRSQVMRAVATLLGVKASGPGAGTSRNNTQAPAQGGQRRG